MKKQLVFALLFGVLTTGAWAQTSREGEDHTTRELKEWIASYLKDLPNFICEYSEVRYQWRKPGALEWLWNGNSKTEKRHKGEVRFIDGKDEYRVISLNGKPSKKSIWEVTGFIGSFAQFRFMLDPKNNFRFTPNGQGDQVSFKADAGRSLHKGYTKDGISTGWKAYPTWGTLWTEEGTHAILKIQDHAAFPGNEFSLPFDFTSVTEYGYFPIGGKRYLLPKREDSTGIATTKRGYSYQITRTYENCRRFGADTVIKYGELTDGSP